MTSFCYAATKVSFLRSPALRLFLKLKIRLRRLGLAGATSSVMIPFINSPDPSNSYEDPITTSQYRDNV